MSDLSPTERLMFERLLGMSGGYVLDFSTRSFRDFVIALTGIDIFDQKYDYESGSKANRLRAFLKLESNQTVGTLLAGFCTYIRSVIRDGIDEALLNDCETVANRLLVEWSETRAEPLLFISYARPDLVAVRAIVSLLSDAGIPTWFDKKDLRGGEPWEYVIRQRISEASLVLVCLSTHSVDRKGFFHQEMRYAVGEAMKLPKGKVFIMPVCLNKCQIPDDLRQWHAIELWTESASYTLLDSIGHAINCGARARSEAHALFGEILRKFNAVD